MPMDLRGTEALYGDAFGSHPGFGLPAVLLCAPTASPYVESCLLLNLRSPGLQVHVWKVTLLNMSDAQEPTTQQAAVRKTATRLRVGVGAFKRRH